MKAREFERELAAMGAAMVHTDGDHHIWRLPNGERLLVPVGGKHSEIKPYLVSKVKRLLRRPAGGTRAA
jgi:predicted RNA binding protein YcfA (HicA-like mRNA interferase family)